MPVTVELPKAPMALKNTGKGVLRSPVSPEDRLAKLLHEVSRLPHSHSEWALLSGPHC